MRRGLAWAAVACASLLENEQILALDRGCKSVPSSRRWSVLGERFSLIICIRTYCSRLWSYGGLRKANLIYSPQLSKSRTSRTALGQLRETSSLECSMIESIEHHSLTGLFLLWDHTSSFRQLRAWCSKCEGVFRNASLMQVTLSRVAIFLLIKRGIPLSRALLSREKGRQENEHHENPKTAT